MTEHIEKLEHKPSRFTDPLNVCLENQMEMMEKTNQLIEASNRHEEMLRKEDESCKKCRYFTQFCHCPQSTQEIEKIEKIVSQLDKWYLWHKDNIGYTTCGEDVKAWLRKILSSFPT